MKTPESHSNLILSVVFSPDGTRIASRALDNTIGLWDAVGGAHMKTLEGHSDAVRSVVFSPDGTRIASGSGDHTIRLWDAASGTPLKILELHSSNVELVVFSPDGKHILSHSHNSNIRLWDAVSGDFIGTRSSNSGSASIVQFSLNDDGKARKWGTVTGKISFKLHILLKLIYSISSSRSSTKPAIFPGGWVDLSFQPSQTFVLDTY